jgi:hypothetical protein
MLLLDVNHPVASPDFPCEAQRGRSKARGLMANERCAYTSSQPSHAGSIASPVLCLASYSDSRPSDASCADERAAHPPARRSNAAILEDCTTFRAFQLVGVSLMFQL